ncbi:TIGR01777 family protein [Actinobacteria bacterium IMCC26207]|nr:TIGR01777 family protein [Actinobacteria bacterium IMCC26207]
MKIALTGASGLIGTQLMDALLRDGHELTQFSRPNSAPAASKASGVDAGAAASAVRRASWDPSRKLIDASALKGIDAVIHLAGVGIADSRWTAQQKDRILTSRTLGTSLLATALAAMDQPPAVLLSGSAIGYYGEHGDEVLDESGTPGSDFTARVCIDWEAAAQPAVDAGIRVALLRTGIVQSTEGGALAKQLPFFKLGLGGKVGSGKQYISWISIEDEVRAIQFLLTHELAGAVNLTAPEPVTNAEYTKILGGVLHRPTTILPITGPRLLFGKELADSLLLTSSRVVPAALLEAGFTFSYPELEPALAALLA